MAKSGLILTWTLCLLVFLSSVRLTNQQIQNKPLVANLYENAGQRTDIITIDCQPAPPAVSVVLDSTIQTTPGSICTNCFQVFRDPSQTHFHLYYLQSQGSLDFATTRNYIFHVRCLNDTGALVDEADVDIRVITNEPPKFVTPMTVLDACNSASVASQQINAKTATAGQQIFQVTAADPDNDPVFFTMTTVGSDNFEIGLTDGIIRAKYDLSSECWPQVIFHVYITDDLNNVNRRVGPAEITCTYMDHYRPVTISNVNKEISRAEDEAFPNLQWFEFIPNTLNTITYELATVPSGALYLFDVQSPQNYLRLMNKLNYESGYQNINITIKPIETYCAAIEHFLYLRVTDANDPPILSPDTCFKTVNESNVYVDCAFSVFDEDFADSYSFSIVQGNAAGLFTVHPITGVITSSAGYDVDQAVNPTTATLLVEVKDTKGNAVDNTTVTITIVDVNDNAPIMQAGSYAFSITDCTTSVGSSLGTIVATDLDSAYNYNNIIEYDSSTNGQLTSHADGSIVLSAVIPAGTQSVLSVGCTDKGLYPGNLRCVTSATVTVTGTACPTTPTVPTTVTVTVPTVATVPTTTPVYGIGVLPTGSPNGDVFSNKDNVAWIVTAALLGVIGLGIMAYMVSKFCIPFFSSGGSIWHTCNIPDSWCRKSSKKVNKIPVTPRQGRTVVTPRDVHPKATETNALQTYKGGQQSGPPAQGGQGGQGGGPGGNSEDIFWRERYPNDYYYNPHPPPVKNALPNPADGI